MSACATCDGFFFRDKEIAVVGGGDTALEEATFLTRFARKVHLLHRRDEFRGSKIMVERAFENPKIEVHTNTDRHGGARRGPRRGAQAARHDDRRRADDAEPRACSSPSATSPTARSSGTGSRSTPKGYLVVHDHTATRIDGVFVAGDVHDHRYRQAVTAAGDGCRAAIDAERWLEAQGITEASTAAAW